MKQAYILGLDSSLSCTGWALLDIRADRIIEYGRIYPPAKDSTYLEKVKHINDCIDIVFGKYKSNILAVAIEQPNSFRGGEVTRMLIGLFKIVQYNIWVKHGLTCNELNTKTAKKVFTSHGDASKELTVLVANAKFGLDLIFIEKAKDKMRLSWEDAADAMSVAYALRAEIAEDAIKALDASN